MYESIQTLITLKISLELLLLDIYFYIFMGKD